MKLDLNADQLFCLKTIAQSLIYKKLDLAKLLSCQIFSASFEGVTIGLILFALKLLVEDSSTLYESFPVWISSWAIQIPTNTAFFSTIALAILAQLLKGSFDYLLVVYSANLKAHASISLYGSVSSQLMRLSQQTIDDYKAGFLSELLTQTEALTNSLVFNVLRNSLNAIFILILYITIMLYLSPSLTTISATVIILVALPTFYTTRILKRIGRSYAEESLSLGSTTIQYLNSPRLLRVFGQTASALDDMSTVKNRVVSKKRKSEIIIGLVTPFVTSFFMIGLGLILILGVVLLDRDAGTLSPIVITFLIIANRMQTSVLALTRARMVFMNSLGVTESVGRFLKPDDKQYIRSGNFETRSISTAINFDSIAFQHSGADTPLFNDLTFSIPYGKTTAIIGPSGSGKSTLIDILLGLYPVSSGTISVNNTNIWSIDHNHWSSFFGVVDQDTFLYNGTVADNIRFGASYATEEQIIEAAKLSHADTFINRLSVGYDTIIGDRGLHLSGGQRQRIAIARALIRNPSILVLDEATSALDSESEQMIQATLAQLQHTRTIIVIAHRLSTLTHADHLIVLENGKIIEDGSPNELLSTPDGHFRRFWNTQMGDQAKFK